MCVAIVRDPITVLVTSSSHLSAPILRESANAVPFFSSFGHFDQHTYNLNHILLKSIIMGYPQKEIGGFMSLHCTTKLDIGKVNGHNF